MRRRCRLAGATRGSEYGYLDLTCGTASRCNASVLETGTVRPNLSDESRAVPTALQMRRSQSNQNVQRRGFGVSRF